MDLPASGQNGIDMSKPMGQLLDSVKDLNQTIRSGFDIVAVCADNWRQTMFENMSAHDDRLSKLEQAPLTFENKIQEIRRVDGSTGVPGINQNLTIIKSSGGISGEAKAREHMKL